MKEGKENEGYSKQYLNYANGEQLFDADFKRWTRNNLRNDGKFCINDFDAVIRDRGNDGINNIMIVEVKRKMAAPKENQKITYRMVDALIRAGIEATNGIVNIKINDNYQNIKVNYTGVHLLQLSDETFSNSNLYFDNQKISSEDLIKQLNFENINIA